MRIERVCPTCGRAIPDEEPGSKVYCRVRCRASNKSRGIRSTPGLKPLTETDRVTLEAIRTHGSATEAAKALGLKHGAMQARVERLRDKGQAV